MGHRFSIPDKLVVGLISFSAGALSAAIVLSRNKSPPITDIRAIGSSQNSAHLQVTTSASGSAHRKEANTPEAPVQQRPNPMLGVQPVREGDFAVTPGVVWEGTVTLSRSAARAAKKGFEPRHLRRRILCADALEVLGSCGDGGLGGHVITSMPCSDELSNMGLTLPQYREWFSAAARAVLLACPADNFVIFYQSDEVSSHGQWHSKFAWIHAEAEQVGAVLLWHKVMCIRPPDKEKANLRPGYSHMVCFSRKLRVDDAVQQPDVLSSRGDMLWPKAMGQDACKLACRFVYKRMLRAGRSDEASTTVVDPFCGRGTAVAVANLCGLHGYGIERSRKRCVAAAKEVL
eukprot:m.98396 g.98396  ORF g.98396 m.98396 type:complete len:346 (+) comp12426_c0_seq4:149-1186(+)